MYLIPLFLQALDFLNKKTTSMVVPPLAKTATKPLSTETVSEQYPLEHTFILEHCYCSRTLNTRCQPLKCFALTSSLDFGAVLILFDHCWTLPPALAMPGTVEVIKRFDKCLSFSLFLLFVTPHLWILRSSLSPSLAQSTPREMRSVNTFRFNGNDNGWYLDNSMLCWSFLRRLKIADNPIFVCRVTSLIRNSSKPYLIGLDQLNILPHVHCTLYRA